MRTRQEIVAQLERVQDCILSNHKDVYDTEAGLVGTTIAEVIQWVLADSDTAPMTLLTEAIEDLRLSSQVDQERIDK